MGVVIVAYFGAMCITGSENIIRYATWQLVCVGIALIIPSIIGAIASFCYFIRCKNDKIWSRLISVAAIWGIIRIVINNYQMIRYAEQYLFNEHHSKISITNGHLWIDSISNIYVDQEAKECYRD